MEPVDQDELAKATRIWTCKHLVSFPLWEFEDIWDQGYIEARAIVHLWNASRGSLSTFLELRLYERVRVAYLLDIGFLPVRRRHKGKWHKRGAILLAESLGESDPAYLPKEKTEMPVLKENLQATFMLLRWGLTQKQIAALEGISDSAVCQRVRKIRQKVEDCNRP